MTGNGNGSQNMAEEMSLGVKKMGEAAAEIEAAIRRAAIVIDDETMKIAAMASAYTTYGVPRAVTVLQMAAHNQKAALRRGDFESSLIAPAVSRIVHMIRLAQIDEKYPELRQLDRLAHEQELVARGVEPVDETPAADATTKSTQDADDWSQQVSANGAAAA